MDKRALQEAHDRILDSLKFITNVRDDMSALIDELTGVIDILKRVEKEIEKGG